MRAVVYHADSTPLWNAPVDAYKRLFQGFVKNVRPHTECIFHLTLDGNPGWGDATLYPWASHKLQPENVMFNREFMFTEFMRYAAFPTGVYWFTEPDARIHEPFPTLPDDVDLALLWRNDDVHITPSFRLARQSALPVFQWVLDHYDGPKDWHGDSMAFNKLYDELDRPQLNQRFTWNNVVIEMRDYHDYTSKHSRYVRHWKADSKQQLLEMEK